MPAPEDCARGRRKKRPQTPRLDVRAPAGQHTCWAYCHTPPHFEGDLTETILRQIERFAPGFRDLIIGSHAMKPRDLVAYNPNYVGGDIIGGVQDLVQMVRRPIFSSDPYSTPVKNLFLCSASTPPGAGVHGMCGYHAARSALHRVFGLSATLEE